MPTPVSTERRCPPLFSIADLESSAPTVKVEFNIPGNTGYLSTHLIADQTPQGLDLLVPTVLEFRGFGAPGMFTSIISWSDSRIFLGFLPSSTLYGSEKVVPVSLPKNHDLFGPWLGGFNAFITLFGPTEHIFQTSTLL